MGTNIISNVSLFTPLCGLNISKYDAYALYEELRVAFEDSHPNNMVDASDADVLTVFPFKWGDTVPDKYEVTNYATGMVSQWPALCKMDESGEVLVLKGNRLIPF